MALISIIIIILILSCKKNSINYENFDNNLGDVYVLRAYLMNEQTIKAWDKFLKNLPNERCFILYDNTKNTMNIHSEFYNTYKNQIILHTETDSEKINSLHASIKSTPESSIIIAYNYISSKISFDYLWLIEEDIYIDGSLKDILSRFNSDNSDILARDIEEYNESPNWNNWSNFFGQYKNLELNKQVKVFLPIIRFSHNYLEILKANLGVSSGFCEVYFVTLAKNNNLTYNNLPDNMFGEFYAHKVINLSNLPNNNDNKLYHKFVYEYDHKD